MSSSGLPACDLKVPPLYLCPHDPACVEGLRASVEKWSSRFIQPDLSWILEGGPRLCLNCTGPGGSCLPLVQWTLHGVPHILRVTCARIPFSDRTTRPLEKRQKNGTEDRKAWASRVGLGSNLHPKSPQAGHGRTGPVGQYKGQEGLLTRLWGSSPADAAAREQGKNLCWGEGS